MITPHGLQRCAASLGGRKNPLLPSGSPVVDKKGARADAGSHLSLVLLPHIAPGSIASSQ